MRLKMKNSIRKSSSRYVNCNRFYLPGVGAGALTLSMDKFYQVERHGLK